MVYTCVSRNALLALLISFSVFLSVEAFHTALRPIRCVRSSSPLLRMAASTVPTPPVLTSFDDNQFYNEINKEAELQVEAAENEAREMEKALQLSNIMKAIPPKAFEKNVFRSIAYMLFDYAMWGGAFFAMLKLVNSSVWTKMNFLMKAAATLTYWNVAGFFMWCIFVIGHDCGHTSFSNNKLLNDIVGHITHGSILVPFYPWQLSHRRHHMFHNHIDKDYSYAWFDEQKENQPEHKTVKMFHGNFFLKLLLPFFGWPLYLAGSPDGNHFFPFKGQRIWNENPKVEQRKCLISAAVVLGFLGALFQASGRNLAKYALFYWGPHVVFGWWLVTVTYLQHHGPKTVVYEAKDWKYVDAAFQTIDRKFGFGVDQLSHHITDGHVIHHIFFTKIPHYNLPMATAALRSYLEKNKLSWLYQLDKTYDFPLRIHKYLVNHGFRSPRATSSPHREPATA